MENFQLLFHLKQYMAVLAAMEVTKWENRKPYKQTNDTLRASICRYALENINTAAEWKYSLNKGSIYLLKKWCI